MADWKPDHCPNGHELAGRNVTMGWTACTCQEPGSTGKPAGHTTAHCWPCGWEWRKGGCDEVGEWHQRFPPERA